MAKNQDRFLDALNEEKLKAQERRGVLISQKLAWATGLFSVGSAAFFLKPELTTVLYFVPVVAIIYDLYIIGEDFGIKRMGTYVRLHLVNTFEADWEKWIIKAGKRDKYSRYALPLSSAIIFIASTITLLTFAQPLDYVVPWCIVVTSLMFATFYSANKSLVKLSDMEPSRILFNNISRLAMPHEPFIQAAIEEAEKGLAEGGIPIGSVLVLDGEIVGRGHNQRIQKNSPTLHAEMAALESAGRLRAADYKRSTLYTTLSPCAMCSGAILLYQIPEVVIGENKTFRGEEDLLADRGVHLHILDDPRCIALMEQFIRDHPDLWAEDIGE